MITKDVFKDEDGLTSMIVEIDTEGNTSISVINGSYCFTYWLDENKAVKLAKFFDERFFQCVST